MHRDGSEYIQEYEIGNPKYPVKKLGSTKKRGTVVTFQPDSSIFTDTIYQYDILASRLRELSFLNKGIEINLTDLRDLDEKGAGRTEKFHSEGGLKEFVQFVKKQERKNTMKKIEMLRIGTKINNTINPIICWEILI